MPKLQHQTRRDGIIIVGSTKYELDGEGCVEVSDEHAKTLLRGKKWKTPGSWKDWERRVSAATPPVIAGARRVRTKAELYGLAEAEGVEGAVEALKAARAPDPLMSSLSSPEAQVAGGVASAPVSEEEDVEEIEVSADMKKAELVAVAEQLGLEVVGKTKTQILAAIEAAVQE